jgi:hypothetical protein
MEKRERSGARVLTLEGFFMNPSSSHSIQILKLKQVGGHPIMYEGMKAWVELCEKGYSQKTALPFNWDDQAIIAMQGSCIVGFIIFSVVEYKKITFVSTGYVKEAYRRQGIYKLLYGELENLIAEKLPEYIITGGVTFANKDMQLVMERLGREPIGIIYEKPACHYTKMADKK